MFDLSQAKRLKKAGYPQDICEQLINDFEGCDYVKLTCQRKNLADGWKQDERFIAYPTESELMDWLIKKYGSFCLIGNVNGYTLNKTEGTTLNETLVKAIEFLLKEKENEKSI